MKPLHIERNCTELDASMTDGNLLIIITEYAEGLEQAAIVLNKDECIRLRAWLQSAEIYFH